jgi:hypothetical protein
MLTCIFHPIDPFRVVEHDEALCLIQSDTWFDCPAKADAYRKKVEEDVIKEKSDAAKPGKKAKSKEQDHERQ